eukprot:11791264-Heterocapsa_arctica.AAC.1
MDMHNKSSQVCEDMESIREIISIMMKKVKDWTGTNYPDRDRINREAQEEKKALDEDMTAREAERQADDKTEGLDKEMMAEDIQNICSHKLSESGGVWRTRMNNEQLGELTQWMRSRGKTGVDKKYPLESDNIFYIKEHWPSWQEQEAQKMMYDALTDGHHGIREETFHPGYRFRMDLHSFKGW